jgi:hypothetical protein
MDRPSTFNQRLCEGEAKIPSGAPVGTWPLDTPGGRFHAKGDNQAPVTRELN